MWLQPSEKSAYIFSKLHLDVLTEKVCLALNVFLVTRALAFHLLGTHLLLRSRINPQPYSLALGLIGAPFVTLEIPLSRLEQVAITINEYIFFNKRQFKWL